MQAACGAREYTHSGAVFPNNQSNHLCVSTAALTRGERNSTPDRLTLYGRGLYIHIRGKCFCFLFSFAFLHELSCRGHSFWLGLYPLGAMLYLYPFFIASLNELRQIFHSSDNDKHICLSSRYDTANNMKNHEQPQPGTTEPKQTPTKPLWKA
ncbi:uncharacterized protein B0T23DRAFT_89856 [Neurospora hispaniola]|uniref:Uncharacterized protein n=1 Tax=Neurospora hispaniola TaxID=588809 RepID=A0AAJ0MU49_9PEZI|nr:hypothetical protein B0T23DRAFT_89856 [Neurospora hispaniola]